MTFTTDINILPPPGVTIHPTAKINCNKFVAGEGTIIRAHTEIYGDKVVLGRESFIDEYAVIGGGSAGNLVAGDWFHMGMFSQVNTACDVKIGNEVGIGIGSRVFTHGAYLSELDGFPVAFESVTIGDRVWLPNAIVMPGVTIGSDVVVAAGSVVSKDIFSNTLAAGSPATTKRSPWPKVLPEDEREEVLRNICKEAKIPAPYCVDGDVIDMGITVFDTWSRDVTGIVTPQSERLRNQLRRHGIRFPVWAKDTYVPW